MESVIVALEVLGALTLGGIVTALVMNRPRSSELIIRDHWPEKGWK